MKLIMNLIQIHEDFKLKAHIIKPLLDSVFKDQPAIKLIDSEQITLGFFYMFIYKDFAIREVVNIVLNTQNSLFEGYESIKDIFKREVEDGYQKFIKYYFTQWMNFMLAIDVFQSYSTIVTPNEAKEFLTDSSSLLSNKDILALSNENQEIQNYRFFFNKYVQIFYRS